MPWRRFPRPAPPQEIHLPTRARGDRPSDNVPGVPSVGPKTAADLVHKYGDLDGVYANLADIKRDKLRAAPDAH